MRSVTLVLVILLARVGAASAQPEPPTRQVPAIDLWTEPGTEADRERRSALQDVLDRSRGLVEKLVEKGRQGNNNVGEGWDLLHPSDNTCVSNTAPSAMPRVPSMCAGADGCSACYASAYTRLNRTRTNLERLRCIYRSNEDYVERAKSFGDDVSSVHGLHGLAWQQERRKIEKAFDDLGKTYDAKYTQLLGSVREDLVSIGACEARHFNNPDWMTRYGFMFYTFVEDRYRR